MHFVHIMNKEKAAPVTWGGLALSLIHLTRVSIDFWLILVVLINKEAIDERTGVDYQYPQQHSQRAVI
jgi:hypothetical protein